MTLIAAVLLFLAIWIVMPAPNVWLMPIGVGAPELSPILLIVSLLALLVSFRGKAKKKIAIVLSLAAAGMSAVPMSQVSRTTAAFDRRMAAAFPDAKTTGEGRPSPIVIRDLFMGLQTGEPRVIRGVTFAAPEGMPLVLDIHKPRAEGKYPIIVQIHGGSWQRGARTDQETFARYFASHGYVVIAVEYRLAPRWQWPAQLDDINAALAWVRANEVTHEGDADRMAVVGRSAGGQLALVAAYSGRTPVRAVVSFYGPADLTEGWNDPPKPDPASVRPLLEAFLGGDPSASPVRYTEASPVTWASGRVPPTLQIQGARDHVVRPRFARDLHQRLQAAGSQSVLLEIPWAEHAFDHVPHGLGGQVSLYYVERFLSATLAPRR